LEALYRDLVFKGRSAQETSALLSVISEELEGVRGRAQASKQQNGTNFL
jgi:hypothetical protein